MTRIEVDYRIDGVMRTDEVETGSSDYAAAIQPDARGYVRVPGETRLYRRIERIVVREDGAT